MVDTSDTLSSEDAGHGGMEVRVLRSDKRADTYLFVPEDGQYEDLPQGLRDGFGEAKPFLSFFLHQHKLLAQADAAKVLKSLREHGFYLQLPPSQVAQDHG
jgi:uncharacterized protein YcgL (UPF0745 family)